MLRRVAQALRVLLLVLGGIAFIWYPFSYFWYACLTVLPPGLDSLNVSAASGVFRIDVTDGLGYPRDVGLIFTSMAKLESALPPSQATEMMLRPKAFEWSRTNAGALVIVTSALPLWLLAFVCLAWPVTSFIIARRRRGRGFPMEAKVDRRAMFIVLLDEPGLFVFQSAADAGRNIEPIDAEAEVRAAFDDLGVPYRVDWIRPNRHGTSLSGIVATIDPGEYRFVPAGPPDPAALARILEEHPGFTQPLEAKGDLDTLLATLRSR